MSSLLERLYSQGIDSTIERQLKRLPLGPPGQDSQFPHESVPVLSPELLLRIRKLLDQVIDRCINFFIFGIA